MGIRKTIRALFRGKAAGVDADEQVVFFPTAAEMIPGRRGVRWRIPIHGRIFQPTEFTHLRKAGLWLLRQLVSRRARGDARGMALWRQRAGAFFADNKRWHRVFIQVGEGVFKLRRSAANGHFRGRVELGSEELAVACPARPAGGTWVTYRAVMREGDARVFDGRALLLPPEGLSVVSDIDDTIKVTEVPRRRAMLANTFLKEFASVPAMAAVYQRWAAAGAAFHYVSASPWHLYPFLAEFLKGQGFPEGTFHLRDFRLMPADLQRTLRRSRGIKLRQARNLLERFPRRRFRLVGDSGESDPLIYARLYADFPRQIEGICIRNVTGEDALAPRWERVFRNIPGARWRVFSDPGELPER